MQLPCVLSFFPLDQRSTKLTDDVENGQAKFTEMLRKMEAMLDSADSSQASRDQVRKCDL